jgi:hypothetical protein
MQNTNVALHMYSRMYVYTFTFCIMVAKFINLMLEEAFNSEKCRTFFNSPQFELNIPSRQVFYRFWVLQPRRPLDYV